MRHSVLETARTFIRRRRFNDAIMLLESYVHNYKGSFEYYLALGTACLYIGDEGNAQKYYQQAREIKLTNSELMLGQAAIFLRRGETSRALQYYLDILNTDPMNEVAQNALEFIRIKGDDYDLICQMKDNGKIEQFYPPLGMNPDIIRNCVFIGIGLGILISLCIVLLPKAAPKLKVNWKGPRANLTQLALDDEPDALVSADDGTSVLFMMDATAISQSYRNAIQYYQDHRDNAAHVEINRLLNSNASLSVKQKAANLQAMLEDETFDTLLAHPEDSYTYAQVEGTPALYRGCFVSWTGRVAESMENDDGSWQCRLSVGYENLDHIDGRVPVRFAVAPRPSVDVQKPIRILGVVTSSGGRLALEGRAYYQPVRGTFSD